MDWIRDFVRKHLVGELPREMDRCGYCNKEKCSDAHFATCANRLKTAPPDPTGPET